MGGNADPRDVQVDGRDIQRLYLFRIPNNAEEDEVLIPRTQRMRSVVGDVLGNSTLFPAQPNVVKVGNMGYTDDVHDKENQQNNEIFYSDRRPYVGPSSVPYDENNTEAQYDMEYRFTATNILERAAFCYSVANIDDFFTRNQIRDRFPELFLQAIPQVADNEHDNTSVRASLRYAFNNDVTDAADTNFLWFRVVMRWKCVGDNNLRPWQYARSNAGGVEATSGEFVPLNCMRSWEDAWSRLYANISEFYDFGADGPNIPAGANVIEIVRNNNGQPIGMRVNRGVGELLENAFICVVVVEIIKRSNFQPLLPRNLSSRQRGLLSPAPRRRRNAGVPMGCYKKPTDKETKALDSFLVKKQSVIMMRNSDNACFARCLAVLLTKAYCVEIQGRTSGFSEKPGSTRISGETMAALDEVFALCGDVARRYRHFGDMYLQVGGHQKLQKVVAQALCDYCGHDFDSSVNPEDITVFADRLMLKIRIIDARTKFCKAYDIGEYTSVVYLVKLDDHFHAVRSLRGLKGCQYECIDCDVTFNATDGHRSCPLRCFMCHARPCPGMSPYTDESTKKAVWLLCHECNRKFPNKLCFDQHKPKVCSKWMTCGAYGCKPFKRGSYSDLSHHRCGDSQCINCKCMGKVGEHRCYITVKDPKSNTDNLLFFDFECSQSTLVHKVTHVVARVGDGEENTIFKPKEDGDFTGVLDQFCEWLFGEDKFKGFTAIAHNGQGYDFHFVLQWCLNRNIKPSKVIRTGQKLKHMIIEGVRFIDSLCFLLMPLSAMPKTFGFHELSKGYFPHMFNTEDNQLYIGSLPSAEMYTPYEMTGNGYSEFTKWHGLHSGDVFHFQNEIIKYCVSDVDILQRSCLAFQALFKTISQVDPFSYMTIAGACLAVYCSKYNDGCSIMTMLPDDAKFVRRGFFGGRTCVMQAHVVAGPGESIRYVDVTSLYPWVNTFCEYPLGDYKREMYKVPVTDPDDILLTIDFTFGFLEVDITCPRDLLIPLLPEKKKNALQFDLEDKVHYVVCSVELQLALSLGYRVTKIYGRIYWENSTKNLFKDYMLSFLKVKQEASGWGGKCLDGKQVETPEEKKAWVTKYAEEEGVVLDVDSVAFNPGLRAISKLCLNSLWGKTGQRPEHKQVMYTDEREKVINYLEKYKVYEVLDVGVKEMQEVVFSTGKEETQPAFNTCVALAAFTTSHARVRLYSGLLTVGDRAIYCDTDSIIYLSKDGEPDIPIGDKLGEWTDELAGDYIDEFVATGPKSYAYTTRSGKVAVKCKGFKLSKANCERTLNFTNFKAAVDGTHFERETCTAYKIGREKSTKNIVTGLDQKKVFNPTLERKGVVDSESCTHRILPFGYNKK